MNMTTNRTAKARKTATVESNTCHHCGTQTTVYNGECFPCGWAGMAR